MECKQVVQQRAEMRSLILCRQAAGGDSLQGQFLIISDSAKNVRCRGR